ncbi:hypothetical protein [Stygiolobus caldivivus]|uniref:Uncharacterized protein n=1 Tax=Stygiolobus caldivivus TaxID=2824673 RepID=A0A8D5U5R6_9CREN|nr:hypothetical protein [Stygiolobus caldivivus]BCU69575.1 hypothetical protein KN1_08720 [Stygiolobus caldivivus]
MDFKALKIIIVISFSLIILSQLVMPSELMYPLAILPSSIVDFPSIHFTIVIANEVLPNYCTVIPYWNISLEGSGEFTYDALGYCIVYFYNGSTGIFPYNAFHIPFLSHMRPNQIEKAYYWTYCYLGYGNSSFLIINNTMYRVTIEVPHQTLVIRYYMTALSEQELKDVMVEAFKNINVTAFNSEKIYYMYTNNGTCAKFVGIIGSNIIVITNYSSNNSEYDLLYYYKDSTQILLGLTYKVNNYMEKVANYKLLSI